MSALVVILGVVAMILFILNVYQYLVQRAAVRIADILYIMSRNVREKAAEVRRDHKDVEIVEAHLFDISTAARSLLRALGRKEESLGPDPVVDLPPNGNRLDSDSLLRLADNIVYAVTEESPDAEWSDVIDRALERFIQKVPTLERDAAKKIVSAVAKRSDRDANGPLTIPVTKQRS